MSYILTYRSHLAIAAIEPRKIAISDGSGAPLVIGPISSSFALSLFCASALCASALRASYYYVITMPTQMEEILAKLSDQQAQLTESIQVLANAFRAQSTPVEPPSMTTPKHTKLTSQDCQRSTAMR